MSGNPVQPNEVAVIPFEVFNGPFPLEGPKSIPFVCQFSGSIGTIPIDFTGIFQRGLISLIQTVYIDNSQNTQETTLTANGTNQTITAPSQSQGYYAIAVTNPPRFVAATGAGVVVPMQFMNVALASSIWFPAGGGQVTIPNDTIEGNISGAPAPPSPYSLSALMDAMLGSSVGGLAYRGAGGWLQLAPSSNGEILGIESSIPAWDTISHYLDSVFGNTQGDILYRDASVWKVLAPGNAGQILESGGASANPSWINAPSSAQIACRAHQSASAQSINYNTFTKVVLDGIDFDTNGFFSSSRFTPTIAGYYLVTGMVSYNSSSLQGIDTYTLIYKNGASYTFTLTNDNSATGYSILATDVVFLNGSGDYIELYTYQGQPSGPQPLFNASNHTFISIAYI